MKITKNSRKSKFIPYSIEIRVESREDEKTLDAVVRTLEEWADDGEECPAYMFGINLGQELKL